MKKKKPIKSRIPSGIIPSQNAIRYTVHQLRAMQHKAMKDAIVFERCGDHEAALSLRLQGDDMRQVAQYLEEKIISP